jgi:hypothetical protein
MRRGAQAASLVALLACAVFAWGCASSNSAMLGEDTALVYATAADPSQREQVLKAALKEAAELTNAHGYRYFVILSATDTTRTVAISVPGHALPNETDHRRTFGATFGNAPERPGNTYTTPDTQLQRVRPGLDIVIRMYRTGEISEVDGVWDAEAMLALSSSTDLRR